MYHRQRPGLSVATLLVALLGVPVTAAWPLVVVATAAAVVTEAADVVTESMEAARVEVVEASELVAALAPVLVLTEFDTDAAALVDETEVLSAALVAATAVVEEMAATMAVEAKDVVLDWPVTEASDEATEVVEEAAVVA